MKIAIGCDPNAQLMKEKIMSYLSHNPCMELDDFGSTDPIYAHTAVKVAEAVADKKYDFGILICGTGLGMSIAANKVKGAYAALITDIYSAQRARLSNNANIACLGAFTIGEKLGEELINAFLTTSYEPGGPSQKKIDAFVEYDRKR